MEDLKSNTKNDKPVRKVRGVVVSDGMNKSRVAKIERRVRHPLVGKFIKKTSKLMFHDEENQSRVGDEVLITPTKPLSARKSFKLLEIVKRAE